MPVRRNVEAGRVSRYKRVYGYESSWQKENERCSIRKSKRVDQGGKSSRLIPAAWIVNEIAGEGWTPIPQDLEQAPFCDHLRYRLFHCRCDTYTVQHCLDNQVRIVERRWSLRIDG